MIAQNKADLLNESAPQYHEGRIRRDHFRGLPKEAYVQAQALNTTLDGDRKMADDEKKAREGEHDRDVEKARRTLVAIEKARFMERKEIVEEEMKKNAVPSKEERRAANQPSRGEIDAEFFKGFGTSTR